MERTDQGEKRERTKGTKERANGKITKKKVQIMLLVSSMRVTKAASKSGQTEYNKKRLS